MRLLLLLVLVFAAATTSRAEASPPVVAAPAEPGDEGAPRSAAGQRLDGRIARPDPRDAALALPRLLLAAPRLVVRGLSLPVGFLVRLNERYRIYEQVMDVLTSDDGLVGVRPALEFASDLRPIFGASFFHERVVGAGTSLHARVLVGGVDRVVAEAQLRPLPGSVWDLEIGVGYRRRDDEPFQGVRSLTPADVPLVRSRVTVERIDVPLRIRVRPARVLRLGASVQLGTRSYSDGQPDEETPGIARAYCVRFAGRCMSAAPDDRLVPGFSTGTQLVRVGASLRIDTRDAAAAPTSGIAVDAQGFYSRGLGDPSSYFTVRGAVEGVIDVYQGTHLLVLGVRVEAILPVGSEVVPFSELAVVGGPDSLRGFLPGRFRDFSALAGSVEYRWAIWMWAEAALFADYGGAFGRGFADFSTERLYPDVGAAIRVRTRSHVHASLQVAHGFPDGWQVYLSTGVLP